MERRTRPRGRAAPGSVAAQTGAPASPLANIAKLVDEGGHIMVGCVPPIDSAAIAYDGTKALAMLRRQQSESIPQLLARLDSAIALAWSEHRFTDEINTPATAPTPPSRGR